MEPFFVSQTYAFLTRPFSSPPVRLLSHTQQLKASPLNVTLWQVDLNARVDASELEVLSPAEQDRAARFRFERDARRYALSHVALRQILAQALGGIDPSRIVYEHNAYGKPRLKAPGLHFNMSHSGDWALIGLSSSHAVGVDLEVCKPMPDAPDLARRHFTSAEYAAYMGVPTEQREALFLRGWTRKEACLKALGSGLSIEPYGFEAGLHLGHQTTIIVTPEGPQTIDVLSIDWPSCQDTVHAAVARLHPGSRPPQ